MEQDIKLDIIKNELKELIKEARFRIEILPESYFIEYFEKEFLIKLENQIKYLQKL